MIFLSLKFYVKSILGECTSAKSAILTHSEPLDFDFYEFLLFLKAKNYQMIQIQSHKNGKMVFLEFLDSTIMISRNISVIEKS